MATIKSFSDLQQSKKLAEILPIESADMRIGNYVGKFGKVDGTNIHYYTKSESFGAPEIVDAWSLAALLDVLPNYQMQTQDNGIGILCSCNGKFNIVTADNPIDACVAMIERLNELKML